MSDPFSTSTSVQIGERIEELYGAALSDLRVAAADRPPGMLSALLEGHRSLALAEQSILAHRERLRLLLDPELPLGGPEVSHLLDYVRRLAEAIAIRDTQAATLHAVLRSLGRTPAPDPPDEGTATVTPDPDPDLGVSPAPELEPEPEPVPGAKAAPHDPPAVPPRPVTPVPPVPTSPAAMSR